MARLLIIDDDAAIRNALREILLDEKYEVDEAVDGPDGLAKLETGKYDVALCDVKMPRMDGVEVLKQTVGKGVDTPIIMITAHADVDLAVEATRLGAYDFIPKPPDLNRLLVSIRNAQDRTTLVAETKTLRRKAGKTREIIGKSPAIDKIRQTIERVAPTDARALVTGPNGVGKELVARWIHELSPRAAGPLVVVNCAAIPSELIESELFGHEKGSFTGAVKQRIGKFEQAHGGTLFLDEIGDMSLPAQAKVLRALQESKIARVGGEKEISVDVRVLSATNKNLRAEIERNNFREDLYHRLSVVIIEVPALKDRAEDIPVLAEAFMTEICGEYGFPPKPFTQAALDAMAALPWTGNIRELHNVVERLIIFCDRKIDAEDVANYAGPSKGALLSAATLDEYAGFEAFQRDCAATYFRHKLDKYDGDAPRAAKDSGLSLAEFENYLKTYGIRQTA